MYTNNEYYDGERYGSAADRKEDQKQRKLHKQAKINNPELYCSTGAFQSLPVNDWLREVKPANAREHLFGELWRPGEVTVFAGETGVGKSILAVQIAESIARGKMPFREPQHVLQFGPKTPPIAKLFPPPRRQRVLYLDLVTSPAKMLERYSCPSPIAGKPPVRYGFSSRFERSGYGEYVKVPDHFRGDLARFLRHSVDLAIGGTEAKIFIIDDLSALEPSAPRSNGPARWLHKFRQHCAFYGSAFLILTHLRSSPPYQGGVAALRGRGGGTSPRTLSLNDLALGRQIAELADNVIAIGRTTYGPEYRYLKVLKSKNAPSISASNSSLAPGPSTPNSEHSQFSPVNSQFGNAAVLAFQLERTTGFADKPKRRARSVAPSPYLPVSPSSSDSSLVTRHSSLAATPALDSQLSILNSQSAAPPSDSSLVTRHPSLETATPTLDSQLSILNSQSAAPPSDSSLVTRHSSLETATPFLAFTYLGPAAEHDLIRDHQAEALRAQKAHERELRAEAKRLKRLRDPKKVVDMLLSPEYRRYIGG